MAGLLACVLLFTFPQSLQLQWLKHNNRHFYIKETKLTVAGTAQD